MDWENLLLYMFSSLFTQNNVAKGLHFTTALEKAKSISEHAVGKFTAAKNTAAT